MEPKTTRGQRRAYRKETYINNAILYRIEYAFLSRISSVNTESRQYNKIYNEYLEKYKQAFIGLEFVYSSPDKGYFKKAYCPISGSKVHNGEVIE